MSGSPPTLLHPSLCAAVMRVSLSNNNAPEPYKLPADGTV